MTDDEIDTMRADAVDAMKRDDREGLQPRYGDTSARVGGWADRAAFEAALAARDCDVPTLNLAPGDPCPTCKAKLTVAAVSEPHEREVYLWCSGCGCTVSVVPS